MDSQVFMIHLLGNLNGAQDSKSHPKPLSMKGYLGISN